MPITLLDLNDQPIAQPLLNTPELPGAALWENRVFFRWQEATYRETQVVKV